MNWFPVCQADEVSEDEPKAVEVNGHKVGIFKLEEQLFAVENVCPHAYALLTDGFIDEGTVECPLHEAIFDIETGRLESGPGCRNLQTFPLKEQGGQIWLQTAVTNEQ